MGKTLLGVDLDESPVGGVVERLLSEEELELLADGGREPDDAGSADESDRDRGSDASSSDGTSIVDDATAGGESGAAGEETPSPGVPTAGVRGRIPSPGDEDEESENGGLRSRIKPLALKAGVALAVLGVAGFVVWRYGGTVRRAVSEKLGRGGDDGDTGPPSEDDRITGDVPEARRRAKVSTPDSGGDASESGSAGGQSDTATARSRGDPERDSSDLGALVGLAALALVAALVRKFGEDRPRDPLVDVED